MIKKKKWDYYEQNQANEDITARSDCRVRRAPSEIQAIRKLGPGDRLNIVEVKINRTWGGICDDGFTISEANVLCRQLGFELGAADEYFEGFGEERSDPINIFGLHCDGNENKVGSLSVVNLSFSDHYV